MKALNVTKEAVLGEKIRTADTCATRMKGLLGTDSLPEGEGLWISPCKSIHSLGMRYEFDALFLDGKNRVVAVCQRFRRYSISQLFLDARGVLELPAGTIEKTRTGIGDAIAFDPAPGAETR